MSYEPPLGAETLQRVDLACRLAVENPEFLSNSSYPPAIKEWLRQLVALRHPAAVVKTDVAVELASTEEEITELLKHLKSLKNSLGSDAGDQLAWVKAGTSLLEKLLTMQERAANIKTIKAFETTVISVLEDFLTPEQRTAFRARLDEADVAPRREGQLGADGSARNYVAVGGAPIAGGRT